MSNGAVVVLVQPLVDNVLIMFYSRFDTHVMILLGLDGQVGDIPLRHSLLNCIEYRLCRDILFAKDSINYIHMDYEKIKRAAREFLNEYNPEGLVPFPFAETAASFGDIKITYLDVTNAEISGAIYFQDDRYTIVINSTKPPVRQYFTLAHEFGHYYLHREMLSDDPSSGIIDYGFQDGAAALLRPDSPPTDTDAIVREKEANNFAAEILMPEEKVKEFWSVTQDIVKCADAFQVSRSAMAIRLERLKLV